MLSVLAGHDGKASFTVSAISERHVQGRNRHKGIVNRTKVWCPVQGCSVRITITICCHAWRTRVAQQGCLSKPGQSSCLAIMRHLPLETWQAAQICLIAASHCPSLCTATPLSARWAGLSCPGPACAGRRRHVWSSSCALGSRACFRPCGRPMRDRRCALRPPARPAHRGAVRHPLRELHWRGHPLRRPVAQAWPNLLRAACCSWRSRPPHRWPHPRMHACSSSSMHAARAHPGNINMSVHGLLC